MFVEGFGGCLAAEGLAGSAIERGSDRVEVAAGVSCKVGALEEVLAKQAVGVLVGASLPRRLWVAEEDRQAGVDAQLRVLRHLRALVPYE